MHFPKIPTLLYFQFRVCISIPSVASLTIDCKYTLHPKTEAGLGKVRNPSQNDKLH